MSSSTSSIAQDDEDQAALLSDPPARLPRTDYEAYSAILLDLDVDDQHDLTRRLVRGRRQLLEVDLDLRDSTSITSPTGSGPRRMDGPSFTPLYQDTGGGINGRKRKRQRDNDIQVDSSTWWPLSSKELFKTPSSSSIDLEEALIAFITSHIRTEKLRLKGSKVEPYEVDDYPVLPDDFIPLIKETMNKLLVCVAGARPVDVKQRRRQMGPMDWTQVMAAACLQSDLQDNILTSVARLQELYQPEEANILTHRLDVLSQYKRPALDSIASDPLYASILPKQDRIARPHQSRTEVATREDKRREKHRLREAKKRAKEQAKEQTQQDPVKSKKKKKQKKTMLSNGMDGSAKKRRRP